MSAQLNSLLRAKWRAALVTLLIFAVAGPPAGALVLTLVLFLLAAFNLLPDDGSPPASRLAAIGGMVPAAILASYAQGLIQALLTGLLTIAHAIWRQRFRAAAASAAAALMWLGYLLVTPRRDVTEAMIIGAVHVVAAFACAMASQPLWKRLS